MAAMRRSATRPRRRSSISPWRGWPVLGVCRGMQVIQYRFGVKFSGEGHVTPRQLIRINGKLEEVNRYHKFAALQSCPELEPWAFAEDGVIEALRTADNKLVGVMWHPERMPAFSVADIELFRRVFGA